MPTTQEIVNVTNGFADANYKTKQDMIDAVAAYANALYNRGGWHVIAEAITHEEVLEEISHCKTVKEAISVMRKFAKRRRDMSNDICSEAF